MPLWWSADGQSLLVQESAGDPDLTLVSLGAEEQSVALVGSAFAEIHGDISPDGRWVAYASNESGQYEIYVRPFPNVDDGRWQISTDPGLSPVWSRDGRELFFRRLGDFSAGRATPRPAHRCCP